MQKLEQDNLSQFCAFEPPADLSDEIMKRLRREKRAAQLKRRLAYFGLFSVSSFGCSIAAAFTLQAQLVQSGFWQYGSLLFYDFWSAVSYWQDYSLALLESLPVLDLTVALVAILALVVSLRSVLRDYSILTRLNHV